jgi:Na+-translocating ferredoxin:NAD+ oxidoreductase subunit E
MKPTTAQQDFLRGVWKENPVLIQMLGLCPALAVTNTVANGLAMSAATFFVLMGSSILVSALRRHIPGEVRISAYILIIATFVTLVDLLLAAIVPDIHRELGAFIALIVVNCMILSRQEAFAARRTVGRSILDAAGVGVGFTIAMVMLSGIREVLGNGTFLNMPLFGPNFEPWIIMILPPGGFFTLGVMMLVLGWWTQRRVRRVQPREWKHQVVVREPAAVGGGD